MQSLSFIENKGQFNQRCNTEAEILYGIDQGSSQIYFTKKGIVYLFAQKEKNIHREEGDKSQPKILFSRDIVEMHWENASPDVMIIAEEKTSDYHSYSFHENGEIRNINKIYGYKKLLYKNLYPGNELRVLFREKSVALSEILIFDIAGRAALKLEEHSLPDSKEIPVDISSLSPGPYFISVISGDTTLIKTQFIKE